MGTTAVTENTEAQEQQKSDIDSDCAQDSCMSFPPSPAVKPKDMLLHGEPEEGQERSVNGHADATPVCSTTESLRSKQGRGGSQSRSKESSPSLECPKEVDGEAKHLQSISQRNRVNGLIVQNKRARGMKEQEKLRQVNEA